MKKKLIKIGIIISFLFIYTCLFYKYMTIYVENKSLQEKINSKDDKIMCEIIQERDQVHEENADGCVSTIYTVFHNRTIKITNIYEDVESKEEETVLSEEDYEKISSIMMDMRNKQYTNWGCIGEKWKMSFEGEDIYDGLLNDFSAFKVAKVMKKYGNEK